MRSIHKTHYKREGTLVVLNAESFSQLDTYRDNFLHVVSNDACKPVWMFRQLPEVVSFREYIAPGRRSNRARNVTRPYRDIIVRRFRRLTLSVAGILYFRNTLCAHCETCRSKFGYQCTPRECIYAVNSRGLTSLRRFDADVGSNLFMRGAKS